MFPNQDRRAGARRSNITGEAAQGPAAASALQLLPPGGAADLRAVVARGLGIDRWCSCRSCGSPPAASGSSLPGRAYRAGVGKVGNLPSKLIQSLRDFPVIPCRNIPPLGGGWQCRHRSHHCSNQSSMPPIIGGEHRHASTKRPRYPTIIYGGK